MKKKIIASLLTLGACLALVSNANINTVNAEGTDTSDTTSAATTITKLYYYNFSNSNYESKIIGTAFYPTCLNTNSDASNITLTYIATGDSNGLSKTISATGSSLDKYNNTTSFTNALKLNSNRTLSLYVPYSNFTITLNYVSGSDGDTEIDVNGSETQISNAKASTTQTVTVNGVNGTNTIKKTDGREFELIEMLITVKESVSNIAANAYIQTGWTSSTTDSTTTTKYFKRFVTIVDNATSVYDLYNVQYKLTYTYTGSTSKEETSTAVVKPHVVDEISDSNKTAYSSTINDNEYSFSNKTNAKYLIYTVAYAQSTTTDGQTTWNYDYAGKVKVEVILNGKTIATKELTFSAKESTSNN